MISNALLHLIARVALRMGSPLAAKRCVDGVARLLPPVARPDDALKMAFELAGRGTCLSRSLAIAARWPRAEVVIGVASHSPLLAHAWVEKDGQVVGQRPSSLSELTRLR